MTPGMGNYYDRDDVIWNAITSYSTGHLGSYSIGQARAR
jgi:hypothetical protein